MRSRDITGAAPRIGTDRSQPCIGHRQPTHPAGSHTETTPSSATWEDGQAGGGRAHVVGSMQRSCNLARPKIADARSPRPLRLLTCRTGLTRFDQSRAPRLPHNTVDESPGWVGTATDSLNEHERPSAWLADGRNRRQGRE